MWDAGKEEVLFPMVLKTDCCSKTSDISNHNYILYIHSRNFLLTVSYNSQPYDLSTQITTFADKKMGNRKAKLLCYRHHS